MTAWTRSARPSFIRTWATWVLAVASLMTRSPAIWALDKPLGEEDEHFELSWCERAERHGRRRRSGCPPCELGDDLARDGRREQDVAGGDDADGGDELAGWCVLEQEAASAGLERLVDVFVEVERAEYEDSGELRVGVE
jgi:hypothetical protein